MNVLFIDSGIGGITTLCTVIKRVPTLNFIYYADNKFAPYGNLNKSTITNRLVSIISSQLKHNIGLIVIACNTATTNSIDDLRKIFKIPIIGTEPAVKMANKNQNNVLVLATPATINHPRFKKLTNDCVCTIENKPLPTLAKLVDNLFLKNDKQALSQIEKIVDNIADLAKNKTHIVLGCTHYVYLRKNIQEKTCAVVLDGNLGVCKRVLKFLKPNMNNKKPTQKFILSHKNIDLCKKYRKIFKQTLANI